MSKARSKNTKPEMLVRQFLFFHGHEGCRYFVAPKTRTEWWLDKINGNRRRDVVNVEKLKEAGWRIITIFECELKPKNREGTLSKLLE